MRTPAEMMERISFCRGQKGNCGECEYRKMEEEYLAAHGPNDAVCCLDYLLDDTLDFLSRQYRLRPANIVPYEKLLLGWGHGWEETHLIGDDEDPERYDLEPCVWIDGHILLESGSSADAHGDHWREGYGRQYGMRIWEGDTPPTEQQRKQTPWTGSPVEAAGDPDLNSGAELLAAAEAYKRESKVFSGLIEEE